MMLFLLCLHHHPWWRFDYCNSGQNEHPCADLKLPLTGTLRLFIMAQLVDFEGFRYGVILKGSSEAFSFQTWTQFKALKHVCPGFSAPQGGKGGQNRELKAKLKDGATWNSVKTPGDASRISPLISPERSLGDVSFLAQLQTWSAVPVVLC